MKFTKHQQGIVLSVGLLLIVWSAYSAIFLASKSWCLLYPFGFFLVFLALNNNRKDSVLRLKEINKIKLYFAYIAFAVIFEIIGKEVGIFLGEENGLWSYANNLLAGLPIAIIWSWPTGFLALYEMFVTFKNLFENKVLGFIAAIIGGGLLCEWLNTFAYQWKYHLPWKEIRFLGSRILNVNIVVIIGWSLVGIVAIIFKRIIEKRKA